MPVPTPPSVISAKLRRPRHRFQVLPRPALVARLQGGEATPPIVALVAPAGYGKTTLLADWARASAVPVRWLRFDADDQRPEQFWAAVAGMVELDGDVGVADVLNALTESPDPRVYVFDDVHRLGEQTAELEKLVNHLTGSAIRLVLAGRAEPLGGLERWRARRDVDALGAADLAFSEHEAAAFFELREVSLPPDRFAKVYERTEGWPAILELVASSVTVQPAGAPAAESLPGRADVLSYVQREALSQVPQDFLELVVCAAHLGTFCAELCDAALERTGSAHLLHDGRRNEYFLVREAQEGWFRLHRLVEEAVRQYDLSEERVAAVHRRASLWFEAHGYGDAAVEHMLQADPALAARQILRLARVQEPRGHSDAALRWFDRLPQDVRNRPAVVLGVGWALAQAGLPLESLEWVQRTDPSRWPHRHHVVEHLVLGAFVRRMLFLHSEVVRDSKAALEMLATPMDCSPERAAYLRLMATNQLIEMRTWNDDVAGARRLVAEVRSEITVSGNRFARVRSTSVSAQIALEAGEAGLAQERARAALRAAEREQFENSHLTAEAEFVLGAVAAEQDELTEAIDRLRRAARLAEQGRWPTTAVRAALLLAETLARAEQPDEAAAALEQAATLSREHDEPVLRAKVGAANLLLNVAADRTAQAATAYHNLRSVSSPASVVRARLRGALALGQRGDLPRLVALTSRSTERRDRVATLLGRAQIAVADSDTATAALTDALRVAEAGRLWRSLLELTHGLDPLLARVAGAADVATGPSPAFVARVRTELSARARRDSALFSARELELAALLPTRLTNEQLAAELFISENTVKTHLRHVYEKLSVSTRDGAVTRLVELGLLGPGPDGR
jgi:LuxR family maltose regulon positive regulatory protein